MTGIKETTEAIKFGLAVGTGIFEALLDDGKITFGDTAKFFPILLEIPDAIAGASEIPAELKDLTEQELDEIAMLILEALPGVGDKWVLVAQGALQIARGGFQIYSALK